MLESFVDNANSDRWDHDNQSMVNASDLSHEEDDPPLPAATLLEMASVEANAAAAASGSRKRPCRPDFNHTTNNDPTDKIMASCNSAFLQDLFEDIASACMLVSEESEEDETQDEHQSQLPGHATASALFVSSENNLAKRRMVSTTQSLERCGSSSADASSSSIMTTNPSTPTSDKTTIKDFPTTISASLSFNCPRAGHDSSNRRDHDELPHIKKTKNGDDNDNGHSGDETKLTTPRENDFGWFVDTDVPDDDHYRGPVTDPYAQHAHLPLAFSSLCAPSRASHCHYHDRAQLEWAQAADTVDEVLGDMFY